MCDMFFLGFFWLGVLVAATVSGFGWTLSEDGMLEPKPLSEEWPQSRDRLEKYARQAVLFEV